MRKTFVYDPVSKEMVEKTFQYREHGVMVMPDIADFVSPIDGKVVHGRKSLREHNLQHNVTNAADFKDTWKRQEKERAAAFTPGSGYDRERRRENISRSIDQLRGRK